MIRGSLGGSSDPLKSDQELLGVVPWPHLSEAYRQSHQSLRILPLWVRGLGLPAGIIELPPAGPGVLVVLVAGQPTHEGVAAIVPDAGSSAAAAG